MLQAGNTYAKRNKNKAQQQQPEEEAKQVTIESYIEDNIEAVGSTILKSSAASVLPDARTKQQSESQPSGVAELLPGQCGNGLCRNGTIKEDDIVFALATHRFNEPTLVAGRAGRVVSSSTCTRKDSRIPNPRISALAACVCMLYPSRANRPGFNGHHTRFQQSSSSKATVSALQGLRTYVCTNYTETAEHRYPAIDSEHWSFYPDDKPLRSFYEGDTRAALVPFLAYRDLGDTFKWLFYGAPLVPSGGSIQLGNVIHELVWLLLLAWQ